MNKKLKRYTVNKYLVYLNPTHFYPPKCWVMERDGGPGHISDSDDILGGVQLGRTISRRTHKVMKDSDFTIEPL